MRKTAIGLVIALLAATHCAAQTSQPAQAGDIDVDSPKMTVQLLATAISTGDAATMRNLLYAKSDTDKKLVAAISETAVAVADLRRALVTKFGTDKANTVMPDPAQVVQSAIQNMKSAVEKIDGDSATVSTGHPPRLSTMSMKKIDGRWKVDVTAYVQAGSPEQVQRMVATVNHGVTVLKDLLAEVNSGKLDSVESVKAEMKQQMSRPAPE